MTRTLSKTATLIAIALAGTLLVPAAQAAADTTDNGKRFNGIEFQGISLQGGFFNGVRVQGMESNGFRWNGQNTAGAAAASPRFNASAITIESVRFETAPIRAD